MRKSPTMKAVLACAAALAIAAPLSTQAIDNIFDTFDVDEGHFNLQPTYSGSTAGVLASSTADRVTLDPKQGVGCERLVINTNGAASARVRFLSGGGSASGNLAFTTSAATDGWIGCYVRTTNAGWTVQLWIEGASVNGGAQKQLTNDGQWHLYEWDLDNTAGSTDYNGWGNIEGIVSGVATVADGSHTIDSIVFRNATVPDASSVIDLDFVAHNDDGSVAELLVDPCNNTAEVSVRGPISTNSNQVVVAAVSGTATAVTVYQDTGSGMTPIGSKTSDITAGQNLVTVSGLVKGAKVAATQTVAGQEGCVPTTGLIVGGGANPRLRVALSIRENPTATGPVGADGATGANNNIHFIPASSVLSGLCPGDGAILLNPSTNWQNVTVTLGRQGIGSSANAVGVAADIAEFTGYIAGSDSVAVRVYAYKTVGDVTVYSATPAQSSAVTSNNWFAVNWTWDAVPGAEGYRLVRDLNNSNWDGWHDVVGATSWLDENNSWTTDPPPVVTPSAGQTTSSAQWFPAVGNTNNIAGEWGILEAIALVNDDPTDTGPFKIYIDNLENGANGVFQDFESFAAGTIAGSVFRQPSYSGTTSGNILTAPNDGTIVNEAAYEGTKSQRAEWQFVNNATNLWVRFTTHLASVMPSPLVNLNEPISFKILVLPVGAVPVPPLSSVTISNITTTTITYGGGGGAQFVLLESGDASAPRSSWTRAQTNTITPGSFTITPSGAQKFYSIKSE